MVMGWAMSQPEKKPSRQPSYVQLIAFQLIAAALTPLAAFFSTGILYQLWSLSDAEALQWSGLEPVFFMMTYWPIAAIAVLPNTFLFLWMMRRRLLGSLAILAIGFFISSLSGISFISILRSTLQPAEDIFVGILPENYHPPKIWHDEAYFIRVLAIDGVITYGAWYSTIISLLFRGLPLPIRHLEKASGYAVGIVVFVSVCALLFASAILFYTLNAKA